MLVSRRTFAFTATAFAVWGQRAAFADPGYLVTLGEPNAPLHLIEYASGTCPHCAHFHENNWATLRTRYINSGRLKITMSEMLTEPAIVAFGMFQLARCNTASAEEYFRRLGILFRRQRPIMETGNVAGVRDALVAIGDEWGLTQEQVMAALMDQAGQARIQRLIAEANQRGVTATPTFFLNGERLATEFQSPDAMTRILDAV